MRGKNRARKMEGKERKKIHFLLVLKYKIALRMCDKELY